MTILQRLIQLLEKDSQLFIKEAYQEVLNRPPNVKELNQYSQLMAQGFSKLDIISELLTSQEAISLFQFPQWQWNENNETIAGIISKFFTTDILTFVKNCYKEILEVQGIQIDLSKYQSLTNGHERSLFIVKMIKSKNLKHQPAKNIPQKNRIHTSSPWTSKNFYLTARQWIQATNQYHNFIQLEKDEAWEWNHPKSIDLSVPFNYSNMEPIPPYVTIIPGGRFTGSNYGAVITPDGNLIKDLSHEMFEQFNMKFPANFYAQFNYIPGNVALLYSVFSYNYFHWMFDVISRIDFLKESGISVDKYVIDSSYPFQKEVLKKLEIPEEKLIQIDRKLNIQAQKLIVPSYTGVFRSVVPKRSCKFLRRELLSKIEYKEIEGRLRLYISRADVGRRIVKNEKQVLEVLSEYGFIPVVLKPLSVAEKIALFQAAEIVIAPHGAGLTNLLFCNPGTMVIELFNANWMLPCYWMICQHLGLDYYYLVGKGERLPSRFNLERIFDDIYVDIEQLILTLKMAIL